MMGVLDTRFSRVAGVLSFFALLGVGFQIGRGLDAGAAASTEASRVEAPQRGVENDARDEALASLATALDEVRLRLTALEWAASEVPAEVPEAASPPVARTRDRDGIGETEALVARLEREAIDRPWSRDASDRIYDWWTRAEAGSAYLASIDCRSNLCAVEIGAQDLDAEEALVEHFLWDPPWNAALHTERDPGTGRTRIYLERGA